MTETTYSTSQAAAQAGLSRKALRLYEHRGLLPTPERTTGGYRRYTDTDIHTLIFIRRARALGLHLDDIAPIVSMHQQGQAPCKDVRRLLDRRITEIDTAIAELQTLRSTLAYARARPDSPTQPGQVCPVIEHTADTGSSS